jgi:hypothetical protein
VFSVVPFNQRPKGTSQQKLKKFSVLSVFSVVPFNHHPDQQHPPGRQQPNIVRVPKGRTKTIILSVPSVLSVVPFPYHHPHGLHQSQTQMKKTLSHLQKMTARFAPRLIAIFPKETAEEKHRFDLLVRAYVDARYKKSYSICKDELEYLGQRVRTVPRFPENSRFVIWDFFCWRRARRPRRKGCAPSRASRDGALRGALLRRLVPGRTRKTYAALQETAAAKCGR